MRLSRFVLAVSAGVLAVLAISASAVFAAAPETPVVKPATAVTAMTATLHGELNPGAPGLAGEYQFSLKASASECRPEGEVLPEVPGASVGGEKEAVSVEAKGLHPSQLYTYCLLATHEGAIAVSGIETFKTLAAKPSVFEGSTRAQGVTPFAATLAAEVNPNNQETTYSFVYATNEALTENAKTLVGEAPLPAEFGERTASVNTGAGLTPASTYYYRVIAKNATGTTEGPVAHFETEALKAPTVASETASAVTASDANLEAKVNPNYQETSYHFEYSTQATGETLEGEVKTAPGSPPGPALPAVSEERLAGPVAITGLTPGVTYFYRVVASNPTGTTAGPVQSFAALAALPILSGGAAEGATRTTVGLTGAINPDGGVTRYHFAYITQADYAAAIAEGALDPFAAAKSTPEGTVPAGNQPVAVSSGAEELTPGTTYDYALVASNSAGGQVGPTGTFTTAPPTPPTAVTGGSEVLSQLSATISGSFDPRGLLGSGAFEFGTIPYQGAIVPATITGAAGGSGLLIAASFQGDLQPATTYYYRTFASTPDGTTYGALQSFTTPGFAAVFPPSTTLPFIPYTSIAQLDAREAKEGKATGGRGLNPNALTRAQKLSKALKACRKQARGKRAPCVRHARKEFGQSRKAKK